MGKELVSGSGIVVPNETQRPIVAVDGELLEQVEDVTRKALALAVKDGAGLERGDALNSQVIELRRLVEDQRKKAKAPVSALAKAIDDAAKPLLSDLDRAKLALSKKLLDFQKAQVEAERARRAPEPEPADDGEDEAPAPPPRIEILPAKPAPRVQSVTTRTYKRVEVVDEDAIPRVSSGLRLLVPDLDAIRKLLIAGATVPGCKLVDEEGIAARPKGGR